MAKASRRRRCFGSLTGMKASFDTDREWAMEPARYRVAPARSLEEKLVGGRCPVERARLAGMLTSKPVGQSMEGVARGSRVGCRPVRVRHPAPGIFRPRIGPKKDSCSVRGGVDTDLPQDIRKSASRERSQTYASLLRITLTVTAVTVRGSGVLRTNVANEERSSSHRKTHAGTHCFRLVFARMGRPMSKELCSS